MIVVVIVDMPSAVLSQPIMAAASINASFVAPNSIIVPAETTSASDIDLVTDPVTKEIKLVKRSTGAEVPLGGAGIV